MHKEKAKTLLKIIKNRSVCYKKRFEGLIKVHVFSHRRCIQLCESINHSHEGKGRRRDDDRRGSRTNKKKEKERMNE